MAVPLTSDQRAALRSGAIAIRLLIDFYLDSGRYSFWDDDSIAVFDGTTYYGVAAFGEISSVSLGIDLGAEDIEMRLDLTRLLNASDDPSDPANILAAIEQESYQQRRTELRYAFFSAETGALIMTIRRFAGLIDQMGMQEEVEPDVPNRALLVVRCNSIARRYGRRTGRRRTHEDQQEIWPGDDFFKFVASTVNSEANLSWGKAKSQPPPPPTTGNAYTYPIDVLLRL